MSLGNAILCKYRAWADPLKKINSVNLRYTDYECPDWFKKLEQPT